MCVPIFVTTLCVVQITFFFQINHGISDKELLLDVFAKVTIHEAPDVSFSQFLLSKKCTPLKDKSQTVIKAAKTILELLVG